MAVGYVFTPMLDSPGNDIKIVLPGKTLAQITAACNRKPFCVGFNSDGGLKFKILPTAQWVRWTDNPCLGFYTRNRRNALLIDLLALLM